MSPNTSAIILLSISEIIALIIITRLWMRRPMKFFSCLIWSIVLLVPLLGLIAFFFLREEPGINTYQVGDSAGGDPGSSYHYGGDGGDGGH
jgi:hypothetical protein